MLIVKLNAHCAVHYHRIRHMHLMGQLLKNVEYAVNCSKMQFAIKDTLTKMCVVCTKNAMIVASVTR